MSNEHVHSAFQDALAAARHASQPVTDAFATFILAVMRNRPHELQTTNTREALEGRVADIEAHILAFTQFLKAEVEDTAAHVALAKRPDDIVESCMTDLAGDLLGHFLQALDRNAA